MWYAKDFEKFMVRIFIIGAVASCLIMAILLAIPYLLEIIKPIIHGWTS